MFGTLAAQELWCVGIADIAQGIMGIPGGAMYFRRGIRSAGQQGIGICTHALYEWCVAQASHTGCAASAGIRIAITRQECESAWSVAILCRCMELSGGIAVSMMNARYTEGLGIRAVQ